LTSATLPVLRQELIRQGLDGFIVPRADEHLGEYVPAAAERLAWLTGFTGSAGMAVVLADMAAVFTDLRSKRSLICGSVCTSPNSRPPPG
jgi:Xaa-Pro aminopeptidase